MTAIARKHIVHAPLASADSFLKTVFTAHPTPNGAGARIVLHVGDAAQAAIVTLESAHRPGET